MKIVDFEESNAVIAKNQPPYLPLPAYRAKDGAVTSCWKATLSERIKILFTGKIWLKVLTFNEALQPQKMLVHSPMAEELGQ